MNNKLHQKQLQYKKEAKAKSIQTSAEVALSSKEDDIDQRTKDFYTI